VGHFLEVRARGALPRGESPPPARVRGCTHVCDPSPTTLSAPARQVNFVNPTFITDHPRSCPRWPRRTGRGRGHWSASELFVLTKEIANAYTELNNPIAQRERFAAQAADKASGDDEAQVLDEEFDDGS